MSLVSDASLAHGELEEDDYLELQRLKEQIYTDSGFFCAGYKEKCLRRRLAIRMRACGVHRYSEYGELLRGDAVEYERLLNVLTINVSKFFRNIEVWQEVEREVLPALFSDGRPRVRIWSAGSAAGEEPYTIAIMLREYAMKHGLEDRLARCVIVGTDIDRQVLERARLGEYNEAALSELPLELRDRWFSFDRTYRLHEEVRRMVRFEPLDLLTDPFPEGQDLVVCRNVMIYFERELQDTLLQRLRDSLAAGGYLVLGKVETIFGPLSREFRNIAHRERIYQCL
jgi:chemotaxis methyl-accepting protein methylase